MTQPQVWYSYGPSAEFPALGTGGIGPMAGPAYRFDAKLASKKGSTAWPDYYDNVPLFYEWTRDYIKAFFGNGARIEDVTPTLDYDNPIDLEFGPDGSLYVLEYGDGFFGKNLPGAELARVDFVGAGGNRAPSVTAVADTTEGPSPLTVHFSAVAGDPEGTRLRYAWDFDADGRIDSRQANPAHTYATDGVYRATVTVTDQAGRTSSDYVEVTVGSRPVVRFVTPTEDQPFAFGDTVTSRSRSPTTSRSTAAACASPTSSGMTSTGTRRPRPRAARAASPPPSRRDTIPPMTTCTPSSWRSTPTRAAAPCHR